MTTDVSLILMRGFPEYLAKSGWDVHVVSAPGELLTRLSAVTGITVHQLPMAREPAPLRDLRALVAWTRLLRRIRPDVMSIGTPKAGLLGMLAGRFAQVPCRVYHLRGLRMETTTGLRKVVFSFAERIAMSSAHEVLAVSKSLRSRAIELRLVPPAKVTVLGEGSSNGVDADEFSPSRFSDGERMRLASDLLLVPGVPVVGFVGRLTEDKGLSLLREAREILFEQGVDHQLLIVGGDESGKEKDTQKVVAGRAGRSTILTGHVAEPAIYYQLMDVLCLPTRREGFPNVVLEAAASGVPTVTTLATGARDSVVDGETGLLAQVESGRDLAEKLASLLTDAGLRRVLGARATRHVRDSFDRRKVWALNEAFYRGHLSEVKFLRTGS